MKLEPYYKLPKELFELRRNKKISLTAFDVYILFLNRYDITEFKDRKGEKYIVYTYENLMKDLNIRKRNSISEAIKELEKLELIQSLKSNVKSTKYKIL